METSFMTTLFVWVTIGLIFLMVTVLTFADVARKEFGSTSQKPSGVWLHSFLLWDGSSIFFSVFERERSRHRKKRSNGLVNHLTSLFQKLCRSRLIRNRPPALPHLSQGHGVCARQSSIYAGETGVRFQVCLEWCMECTLPCFVQGLVQVGDDIDGVFGPHTEAHHVRGNVRQRPPFVSLLLMGGYGRDGGHAFDAAQIGRPPDPLKAVEERAGFLQSPLIQKDMRWP